MQTLYRLCNVLPIGVGRSSGIFNQSGLGQPTHQTHISYEYYICTGSLFYLRKKADMKHWFSLTGLSASI